MHAQGVFEHTMQFKCLGYVVTAAVVVVITAIYQSEAINKEQIYDNQQNCYQIAGLSGMLPQ